MPVAANVSVVVVDDQLSIRGLVRAGLNSIGINQVREFGTAAEALASLKAQPSHIVISDFNMPEMDGLEFLRALRGDQKFKSTAFILLTGRADKELVQRAVQFGANNYLVKPFTVATLKGKIEQVVGALT
ncbi:MAG TPA: response regulator [Alphaproteobacteria bacterium]|nr:response regulator [Alphaproteobacteria bacterium]